MASEIAEAYDHDELADVSFLGVPLLELETDELRSVVVHLLQENERLEDNQKTPEQQAADLQRRAGGDD